MSGPLTLLMYRWLKAFCISWPSLISKVVMCSIGLFPTQWTPSGVQKCSGKPCGCTAPQTSINTDQGAQFTSEAFTTAVTQDVGSQLSMDGKGRAIDNIFIERLWRSVKYEYIYINPPVDGLELYRGLKNWFTDYNTVRRHKSLQGEVPATVYHAAKRQTPEAA